MQRVLIIGCSGSGKTTLTQLLAARTELPVIHLDEAYFGPDWVEPSTEAWAKTVQQLVARERWIMDGNFSGTFSYRLPRADTVIFLDQPTWRCLWRVIRRIFRYYGQVRPGSAPGCRERFDVHFLHYVLRYNKTRKPKILKTLATQRAAGKSVHRLRSQEDIERFLAKISDQ